MQQERLGLECLRLEPAEIAERLASGSLDAGLVPSIELGRQPELRLLPVAPIAAIEEVRSVLLLSQVPILQLKRVAVDGASRTSVVLLELVLAGKYGLKVDLLSTRSSVEEMLSYADAALVIGDRALTASREQRIILDLASEWFQWLQLPFVFAVWAVRRAVWDEFPREEFSRCLESALESLELAAEEIAAETGLDPAVLRDYLTRNLCYRWTPAVERGLKEFLRRAYELGRIPALPAPVEVAS
jgi:chorismate dehydratase